MNAKFAVRLWIVGVASIALATFAPAADWPQWRGLNRAAKAPDFKAPQEWPKELTAKWKVTVGNGDATPSLVGDKLYVFTLQEGNEILRCLDASSGQELWQDKYEAQGATGAASGHRGPRSSPTVAEGKVVTLGVRGMLSCLDAESGKVLWRKDEFKSWPSFFVSSSPIVVEGLCVAQVGGSDNGAVVAYDLASGDEKWKWSGSPAYASPVLMAMDDVPLVVALAAGKIVAIQAKDGAVAWEASIGGGGGPGGRGPGGFGRGGGERGGPDGPARRRGPGGEEEPGRGRAGEPRGSDQAVFQQPQPGERGERGPGQRGPGGRRGGRGGGGGGRDYLASTPIVEGQTIYYAAGGAIKAAKLEKDGDKVVAKELWSNPEAGINFNSPVLKDGLLFGLNRNSQFFCVDAQSGKTAWTGPRDKGGGYGSIVDAGSVLLAITPGSELVVIKPTEAEYTELARIKVSDTQTYAHLVVAGNRLLVKDEDSVALLSVD